MHSNWLIPMIYKPARETNTTATLMDNIFTNNYCVDYILSQGLLIADISDHYVSKLSTDTPIKHVWDRVRNISGKNICPPKQYLNRKDGTAITDPKDIANEHAAVFTDNSSSAHYSATFQAIKEQEEKVKIDFTSDNTEVYNKPFRLRDLRRSILKAKPRAPGLDGIHNNLLKHLPEDTLKILKEILNKIWISADFPQQWRAATVIPIPKPNKDQR